MTITSRYKHLLVAACAALAALALAAPAVGQQTSGSSVTQDQYDENTDKFAGAGGGQDPGVGSLPFTGLDLGLMGAAAVALVGGGIALRRHGAEAREQS